MKLSELICYDEIVIQCHDYPDADTVASGFAVYEYLKTRVRNVSLVYSGEKEISKPNLTMMIEKLNIPISYVKELRKPKLLLTVDCVYGERNVSCFEAENYASIDHHTVNGEIRSSMYEIRENYGSCSSVVAKMLEEEGIDFNRNADVATALYYGLYMDTNGFSEISHPADRDLRDFADFDWMTINILRNTNLSLEELDIAGDALHSVTYCKEHRFAITQARPCDPNILGFISDLILQVEEVDICIVCCQATQHGIKLSVRSCINDMRADELAKKITEGIGNGGGHHQKSGGFIKSDLMGEVSDIVEFIKDKVHNAFESFEIYNADTLDASQFDMKPYVKLPQRLGYTLSTDIMPSGSKICIRTFEADLNVETSEDIYIMISQTGGIYPINREKFLKTYTTENENYVFEETPEYSPRIINLCSGCNDSLSGNLLEYAKACTSKSGASVLAVPIERNLKLYTKWDKQNYMVGVPGDYLAVRTDDLSDFYIIKKKIFEATYTDEKAGE